MGKSRNTQRAERSLDSRSKYSTYILLAILIGVIQLLEDLIDDDEEVFQMLKEMGIMSLVLMVLFPLLSILFLSGREWWRKRKFLANLHYSELYYVLLFLILWPILILLLAFPTFFVDDKQDIWVVWVSSLIFSLIIVVVEVFWDLQNRSQQLEISNERLLRNAEMVKYQALMNQLNPHFLFNSLNVLSFLVHEDAHTSERFIEELSKIYRYILQLNETYLVPLSKELDFVHSYVFLQKIRYQDNLIFNIDIPDEYQHKLLPPLTLEILIENAIKHNTIDSKKPLTINLKIQEENLIVKNNKQARNEEEVDSTQVGLNNLIEKYQILENELPEFTDTESHFTAKIPLLNEEI